MLSLGGKVLLNFLNAPAQFNSYSWGKQDDKGVCKESFCPLKNILLFQTSWKMLSLSSIPIRKKARTYAFLDLLKSYLSHNLFVTNSVHLISLPSPTSVDVVHIRMQILHAFSQSCLPGKLSIWMLSLSRIQGNIPWDWGKGERCRA